MKLTCKHCGGVMFIGTIPDPTGQGRTSVGHEEPACSTFRKEAAEKGSPLVVADVDETGSNRDHSREPS
jgi:hypothetical protein